MGSRYEIDRDRNAPCEVTVEGEEEEEGRGSRLENGEEEERCP